MAANNDASTSWSEECRFWVPGSDRIAYGELRYGPESGPGAHLIDSELGDDSRLEEPEYLQALHGETLGGTPFSLMEVWVAGGHRAYGERRVGNTVDVLASALARRVHALSLSALRLDAAGLKLRGLLECLTGGKVDGGLFSVGPDQDEHASLGVELSNGATLHLQVAVAKTWSRHRASSETKASAWLELNDDLDIAAFDRDYGDPLRDFVTFATEEASWAETLEIRQPGYDSSDRWAAIAARADIIRPPAAEIRPPTSRTYYALALNLATVEDPGELLRRWFDLRRQLGPVWPFLFGTLERPSLPLENQLLNLTAFAEGYHRTLHDKPPLTRAEHKRAQAAMLGAVPDPRVRRVYRSPLGFANSQPQRVRMEWMASRAEDAMPAWDLDVERFAKEVTHTRNWLVHWGRRGRHVQQDEGMAILREQLELVIRINLMRDLGLTENEITTQVANAHRLKRLP